ncbi:MAG: NACHT domain-containing protein [Lewinellaceae bacterium]|nr:NACHT domain-containing protein [Lewinellaceae bacterium]
MQSNLEVTNLISPIISSLKNAKNELENLLQYGVEDYLYTQTEKYYYTNTFLYRYDKVRFKDVYFPVSAKYKKLTTNFEKLNDVFGEYHNIIITGTAGSGKSTLVKYIFLNSIEKFYKLPILIELRHLNEYDASIEEFLINKILNFDLKPSETILKRALKKGSFLFLFDGYDEIFSKKKNRINQQIEEFIDKYPRNNFVITTRPGGGIENFPRFHNFSVCNLTNEDILAFINLLVKNEERKFQILRTVNDSESDSYNEYLKNPLLLSMFILAFESHPEIPKKKSAFYRNVFDTLYHKHDGITKNSFPREKLTKLQKEDFEKILNIFSYITISYGKYAFTESDLSDVLLLIKEKYPEFNYQIQDLIFDLRTSISILIKEGFEYKFPHRSMQEYFASAFISKIPTDKKPKAYKQLAKRLKKESKDNSFNLWSLCRELDYSDFTKFFLLPELKSIFKRLDYDDESELLYSFIAVVEPKLFHFNEMVLAEKFNFSNSLLKFAEVSDFSIIRDFPMQTPFHEEIFYYLEQTNSVEGRDSEKALNRSLNDLLPENPNDKVLEIMLKNDIISRIVDLKSLISQKINSLNDEIEAMDDSLNELLDF